MLAQRQVRWLAIVWQTRGIEQQIYLWEILVAAPEPHLIINRIDSRATLAHVIHPQHFAQLCPHCFLFKRKWAIRALGITHQSFPMPLKGKWYAFHDADRREQTPPIQQACLTG